MAVPRVKEKKNPLSIIGVEGLKTLKNASARPLIIANGSISSQ